MSTDTSSVTDPILPDDRPWIANYPEGVPESIDYPNMAIYDFLATSAKNYPESIATIFFDKEMTYTRLYDKVCRLAAGLEKLAVKKGDRVGIFLPNCPQFVIAFFAIQKLGAVGVAFNPQYKSSELTYQIIDAKIEVMICLDYVLYSRIKKVKEETKLKSIIVTRLTSEISWSKKVLGRLTGKLPLPSRIADEDYSFETIIKENPPAKTKPDIEA
ncbi:MAG: AMP-binding protein, partial [Candidatus Heimdallarchaeota archaeon]|nr:AMP-binding protein [Candidatus Heimdallarchaeota archaeon]